jgi:enoyl-CoA hydratase
MNPPSPDLVITMPLPGVALIQIASAPLGVLRTELKRELLRSLDALEDRSDVRCLVMTGSGRAFSVGSDIREFKQDREWLVAAAIEEQALYERLEASRLPIIAACNGLTLGGGLELALACDIRIAAESATFGLPEVHVGALASGGGTQRLPRQVGVGRALDLMLTGRIIAATEALAIGLVQRLAPSADLLESTLQDAAKIAAFSSSAISATKRCVYEGVRRGSAAGFALEIQVSADVGLSPDAAEGQQAFIEKRPPRFNAGFE